MRDRLVIDIETKNTFADVGGEENLKDLQVSLVGLYSYSEDKLLSFREDKLEELAPWLKEAGLIIGFSIARFDLPVLDKYFAFNLLSLPRFDLLDEIELTTGKRVSLDVLARVNLGMGKIAHALEAPKFYLARDWESLERYCLNDVALTRDLYNLVKKQGHLLLPDRLSGETTKVELTLPESELARTLF